MAEFSKIKLRTKVLRPVLSEELVKREIIFGNYEKAFYIKDLDDNMLVFLPVDDDVYTENNILTAFKVKDMVDTASGYFDVLDGGTW